MNKTCETKTFSLKGIPFKTKQGIPYILNFKQLSLQTLVLSIIKTKSTINSDNQTAFHLLFIQDFCMLLPYNSVLHITYNIARSGSFIDRVNVYRHT